MNWLLSSKGVPISSVFSCCQTKALQPTQFDTNPRLLYTVYSFLECIKMLNARRIIGGGEVLWDIAKFLLYWRNY